MNLNAEDYARWENSLWDRIEKLDAMLLQRFNYGVERCPAVAQVYQRLHPRLQSVFRLRYGAVQLNID